jgi:DNA topoisomerase III
MTRTVVKEGVNKGRQFYKCGNGDACPFFAWADAPVSGSSRSATFASTATTNRAPPNRVSSSSEKTCNCNPPKKAVQREVMKEGNNKGRKFWACPNPISDSCGFFDWADGAGSSSAGPDGGPGNGRECFKVC